MILKADSLYKSFTNKEVLKGMSFQAESGRAVGLLGRNGAGKTTTIRILLNIFPADKGTITLDGRPIDRSSIKIGYLPEERGMYPKKKIMDQLVYFAQLKGLSHKEAVTRCNKWLERFDMKDIANKRLDALSKGNQQKIQLITAVINDPDILILDEPFSGLDPVNAMVMEEVVKEQIAAGKIVFFSGHQMNYIEEFCDDIAILKDGKIVLAGDLAEIKHNYPRTKLNIRSQDIERIQAAYGGTIDTHHILTITMTDAEEKHSVMQDLTNNYDIDEIKVFEPSLADIFVEYAGEGK